MSPRSAQDAREVAFQEWCARVEALIATRLDIGLAEFGALPLRAGFDAGVSAEEFYAEEIGLGEDEDEYIPDNPYDEYDEAWERDASEDEIPF